MPTLRCSICALNWPQGKDYRKCPQCLGKTDPIGNVSAMDEDEAKSLRLHAEFDRFYEEYDEAADPARLDPSLLPDPEPEQQVDPEPC